MSTLLMPCVARLVALVAPFVAGAPSAWEGPPPALGPTGQRAREAEPHVKASLAPSILRTPDGRRFIDVQFAIEPGWHLYWRNPGDSGQPPRLDCTLPEGWSAGEPIFPVPNHLPEDEDILAFEGSLRVLVPVNAPTSWASGSVSAGVAAQWMTCKEHCVVERQSLRAELVEKEAPMPGGYPEAAPAALAARLQGSGDDRVLVVDASALGGTARWFPDACAGVRFSSERMLPMPGGRIEIPVRIREGDAPDRRPVVRGMVVIDSAGVVRAFDLAVPAAAPAAK